MSAQRLVLAVDFGQTACKAAYVDASGTFVAIGRAASRGLPGHGFGPEDGERIWQTFVAAVHAANAEPVEKSGNADQFADRPGHRSPVAGSGAAPLAIALSSRIGLGVYLDDANQPIAVPEAASEELADELDLICTAAPWDDDALGSYAPLLVARALRFRALAPNLWHRVRRVGAFHDWLLLRLTGRWATNPATGPSAMAWPAQARKLLGLPEDALPEITDFSGIVGGLTRGAADALGLPEGTPVVAGYHDGSAATLGVGVRNDGDACITLGTSVALRVVRNGPISGWFRYAIAPGRLAWMRGLEFAFAQIDQVAANLAGLGETVRPEAISTAHQELTRPAVTVPPGSNGLALPVLPPDTMATRLDAVRAAEAHGFSPGAIYRAALEGLALGVAGLAERAREANLRPLRYVATGGGTNNPLLVEMLSAVLRQPIEIGDVEGGIRGAAIAASVGASLYPNLDAASAAMIPRWPSRSAPRSVVEAYRPIVERTPIEPDPWETRPYWRLLPT
ncbi:MAG: hypothetical protein EPO26_13535 [Chloroflexota bacterium]|nr:MAG: hypothetical protein EPO26_13535 [Chloroflexota bacterium]